MPPRPAATATRATAARPSAEPAHEPVAQAITLPTASAAAHDAVAVPPSPPASQPLDLRLRRTVEPPSPAALARQDARLPARPDADARLARALGTDQRLTEQAMADGLRLRQGRGCVDLRPARATALDTFNASARPVPRLASEC
ncbi:hypothetical protein [Ideonella sp. A 288]|uniref:hypothetical protein n=1 Tax=Ideonella sp. A 288 TaxID=1962181 RepID=UPI0011854AD1|nr:hypothetical protein [Ideonella sp. A 288]